MNKSAQLRQDILKVYKSLGRKGKSLSNRVSHHHAINWRNSTMSPYFINSNNLLGSDFINAEGYFKKNPPKKPYDGKMAYLCVLDGKNLQKYSKSKTLAKKLGWSENPNPTTLNIWTQPRWLNMPKGYIFKSRPTMHKDLHSDFKKVCRENFKHDRKFEIELDGLLKTISDHTFTVVIYDKNLRPCGAGLVSIYNDVGFFFCGSICKKHRNKGLWHALVSIRQFISACHGVKFWLTSTNNPHIKNRSDISVKMRVFTKVTAT